MIPLSIRAGEVKWTTICQAGATVIWRGLIMGVFLTGGGGECERVQISFEKYSFLFPVMQRPNSSVRWIIARVA